MPNDYYTMLYTGEKTDELLQRVDEGEIIIPSSTAGSTKKFKLTVDGIASHCGTAPEKGANAIREAAKKIVAIEDLTDLCAGTGKSGFQRTFRRVVYFRKDFDIETFRIFQP